MQINPSDTEKVPERFERLSDQPRVYRSGLDSDEVGILVRMCKADPGAYFVLSKHASQSAASSRVAQMKQTKRWGQSGLHFKSRRIHEEGYEGAVIACWPPSQVTVVGAQSLKFGEMTDDEIRVMVGQLKAKADWSIPMHLIHVDDEPTEDPNDDDWRN